MTPDQLLMFLPWYAMFLLAVTCHEAGHATVAWLGGDPTAYQGGQVSLNPLPHLTREPVGTVVVPLLSYFYAGWMMGWASAPYDPYWEDRHPRRAAAMAAAGPLANLALALIAFAALKVGLVAGTWTPPLADAPFDRLVEAGAGAPGFAEGLGRLLSIMLTLNTLLFVFNLIPFPPLDGASIAAGLFAPARELRERMRGSPTAGLVGLVLAWLLIGRIFSHVYVPIVHLLWSGP